MLYGAGSCIWCRIYQSNFHNIKNQFSEQALGLKPGLLWPASAWFGPILWSNAQEHYASALARILNLSVSTVITPPVPVPPPIPPLSPKILGKCSGCCIQKWLHAIAVWMPLWGPICHKEIRQRADGDPRTCTRHHAEVWEMTNCPLCERLFREAVRRHTVQTGRDTKLMLSLWENYKENTSDTFKLSQTHTRSLSCFTHTHTHTKLRQQTVQLLIKSTVTSVWTGLKSNSAADEKTLVPHDDVTSLDWRDPARLLLVHLFVWDIVLKCHETIEGEDWNEHRITADDIWSPTAHFCSRSVKLIGCFPISL